MMKASDFVNKTVYLELLLGEFYLYKKPLRMLEYRRHFLTIDEALDDFSLDDVEFGDNKGIFLRSFPLTERLPVVDASRNMLAYAPWQYTRSYIDGSGSFDDYLKKFSSKSRATLRRKVRKFDAGCHGETAFKVYSTREEMKDFYTLAREVSKLTYQERLFDSGIPDHPQFVDEMLALSEKDACRGYLLFCDGEAVAYIYTRILDGYIHSYDRLGYKPKFRKYSPGTVLQYKVLAHLFSLGQPFIFDFTEGEGDHKSFFSNRKMLCGDIYLLTLNIRHRVLVYSHLLLTNMLASLTRLLDKLHLKMKIKRLIRRFG